MAEGEKAERAAVRAGDERQTWLSATRPETSGGQNQYVCRGTARGHRITFKPV